MGDREVGGRVNGTGGLMREAAVACNQPNHCQNYEDGDDDDDDDDIDDDDDDIDDDDDFYLGKGLVGRGAWTRDPGK